MLLVLYPLNALLMLGIPVLVAILARRHLGASWSLLGLGAATFVGSQVVHLPLNLGVGTLLRSGVIPSPAVAWHGWLVPLALGLSAGTCEEVARWLVLRFGLRDARSWRDAVAFGVGHGGIEAMILGLLAGISVINLVVLRDMDLGTLGLPPEQLEAVRAQVEAAWTAPAWMALAGAFERACTMVCHVAFSVLVLQAFRRHWGWLLAAIGAHALLDAGAVAIVQAGGVAAAEGFVFVAALALGCVAWALRDPPPPPPIPVVHPPAVMRDRGLTTDASRLDRARYR